MSDEDLAQRVRLRAYYLWEAEGRPHGRDQEYWHRALAEERVAAVPDSVIADVPPLAEVAAEAKPARKPAAKPKAPADGAAKAPALKSAKADAEEKPARSRAKPRTDRSATP